MRHRSGQERRARRRGGAVAPNVAARGRREKRLRDRKREHHEHEASGFHPDCESSRPSCATSGLVVWRKGERRMGRRRAPVLTDASDMKT